MKVITDEKRIDEILSRGVENVYPNKEFFKKALLSGKRLRIYNGIDPTGPELHLGHAITLRKLRQFQDLGHEIILLVGDFTGMIGDPTGKTTTRVPLTRKQVLANCKGYEKQTANILDYKKNPVKIKFNSKWLDKLNFKELISLASHFTAQQMLERDMFQERMKNGKPIGLHEFLYPLMQGYDSVVMDVDMEVGGSDQTFNMLAGRNMVKSLLNKEKLVLTTKLLVDPTGKKMGKTEGNMIALNDSAENMFGKVMSWSDEMIANGFDICTEIEKSEIEKILQRGPRDAKIILAKEIVRIFKNEKEAEKAEQYFINTFSKRETPTDVQKIKAQKGDVLAEVLVRAKIVSSKSDFRRLLDGKAVDIDEKLLTDPHFKIEKEVLVKVGKKKFVKITI